MTNKERQKSLDKKKYVESEKQGKDMSGEMFYCQKCEFSKNCFVAQSSKEVNCTCAKAFNRLQRSNKL